uniref:Deoxynucleoside kinase domain-containing protein n=1 Tax=viral metagenome TaxID=1070528 RepID=A0A6C0LW89_9ZZZZ
MTLQNYSKTFELPNMMIGVSGIIGVGKSTLVNQLGSIIDCDTFFEPVKHNLYLEKFYQDIKKYSFQMQVYLLNHRFMQHQQMVWSRKNCIQDRTIYEDVIFAKMLKEDGLMDPLDFQTYVDLFQNMSNFLHRPDVIIYLDVEPEVALERIKQRGRECEAGITLEYLIKLKNGYEEWLSDIEGRIPVLKLDWNTYQDTEKVCQMINNSLALKKGLVV